VRVTQAGQPMDRQIIDIYASAILLFLAGALVSLLIARKDKRSRMVVIIITFLSIAACAKFGSPFTRDYAIRTLVGPFFGALLSAIGIYILKRWERRH
jgi:lipopolysaccharide export LptBFGC system permease protein LptF